MPDNITVSLSEGGTRALLFGLGVLRAVIAGVERGHQLDVLAGVSGGGIGAAYASSLVNFGSTTVVEYDETVLRPAVFTTTHRSLMFGTWHLWMALFDDRGCAAF